MFFFQFWLNCWQPIFSQEKAILLPKIWRNKVFAAPTGQLPDLNYVRNFFVCLDLLTSNGCSGTNFWVRDNPICNLAISIFLNLSGIFKSSVVGCSFQLRILEFRVERKISWNCFSSDLIKWVLKYFSLNCSNEDPNKIWI